MLVKVAKRKTAEADVHLDSRGRAVKEENTNYGDNVLIVDSERNMVTSDQ